MKLLIRPAVTLFALLTIVTGVVYPLAVTGIAKIAFPNQAAGSLVVKNGQAIGSTLVGQNFSDPKYFWGRPSATSPMAYNAANSGGSNQGPTNTADIPVDLVTASASGIDPEISVAGARYQVARIAKARGISPDVIEAQITRHTVERLFGLLGEPRVNVLELNLELDQANSH